MTVLQPCFHCHRAADCETKRSTLARLRGLAITKASVRCRIPKDDFPSGTVVDVKAFEIEPEFSNKFEVVKRGVVSRWHNGKVSVVLDKAQEIEVFESHKIGYLHVTTDRLTKIGDDVRELCKCGLTQERCENRDYPSTRTGQWECFQAVLERDLIRQDAERTATPWSEW
jgi:hypothetical protein